MPDVTLSGWPTGATVNAYLRSPTPPFGQTGSALDSGTASSAGAVTLTLAAGGPYIATDGTRAVTFGPLTDAASGGGGDPTGAAGGVLSGTYPDPGFAVNMATQAELDAHAADTTAVHGLSDTSKVKGVVVWTSGAIPARPTGFGSVEWVGPADPAANVVDGDTWIPTVAP